MKRLISIIAVAGVIGALTIAFAQSGPWVSYTIPSCASKQPIRFYIFAYPVGATAVITLTSLAPHAVISLPQEDPYRLTLAKGAIIRASGSAQNITFNPIALPWPVEVRVSLRLGAYSLSGWYRVFERLCY